MNKRIVSALLSILMVLSLFAGFKTPVLAEELGEYIIYMDVEGYAPLYVDAYENRDYEKAIALADEALDFYQKQLEEAIPGLEVISRIELLLPSLCVKAGPSDLDLIKKFDFVKDIYANEIIREADVVRSDMAVFQDRTVVTDSIKMVNSNELIGNDDVLQAKYNGAGTVLAIIDSNMDPNHAAFYLTNPAFARLSKTDVNNFISGGKISVRDTSADKKLYEEIYRSEKIPFGWNYNTNSSNLNPEKELEAHGQHVSGTVAGNAFQIDGKTWRGVAPEAQLLMMNVMRQGSTSSNIYIRAMQDAIVMGADAVNMSLGSTKGLPGQADGLVGKAINNGYAADTNFVIAAGNEGQYQGVLNIDNPDFGTMAAPGIAKNAITVASLENKTMYTPVVTFDGKKYIFHTGGEIRFEKGDYNFVDCGLGEKTDFEDKDLTGKVALIKRGGITFNEKVLNAQAANAVGAIIYNNVEGDLYMSVKGNNIPAISITLDTAEILLANPDKKINIDMDPQEIANPQYGELSEFTNWGLSAGGYMKPDITAPGGHIYSTQTMGDTFGDMSGTSMATPHVAGGVGVIRARLNEMLFSSVKSKAELTKTILMNSAVPHVDPVTGQTTSPRRQGAGVMNLTKATQLDFTVVDKESKIASKFVGSVEDTITLDLTIHNYSNEDKTLTSTVQATIEARDGKKLLLRPDELFSKELNEIKVPALSEKDVTITFPIEHLEKVQPFTNGAFVEGFLHLRDQNGMEVSFPFVSFKGSYENIPSIEKPLYEFDFESEKPMYWNLKTKNHEWFKYSTHIETNYGIIKEGGKAYKNIVIAGLKNFDQIDENKNTDAEPKPEFGPIVLSPNGDNYQDVLNISLVMTRTANVKASIIDSAGKENEYNIGLKYSNISTDPDNDKNREQYLGFTSPGAVPLKDLADGDYTLKLTAAAIKDTKESYPETHREIKFTIDTVAPAFEDAYHNEDTKELSFNIKEEGSGIDEFKITDADDKAIEFTRDGNEVSLNIPDGKELADINIYAKDLGHNINNSTAEMLIFKDMFGSLEVDVKQSGREALNLEYKVVDEAGKEYKNHDNLKFGKYKLIVTDYSNKFELKGEAEIPFEISKENKNHKITLEFTEIPTGRITIKVASKDNLEWADFDLFAKNTKTDKAFQFVQDEGIYDQYFDADLPYGDYEFYAEFKNGKEGYSITFDENMPFTVSGSTNYSTITANIKRDGYYKVHITTEGTKEAVEYLAKDDKNGSIVGLDELAEGTWMIFPAQMPAGYYMEKPYEYVTLSNEKPEANLTFNFEEIGDKKFTFTIKDNYDKANYYIDDFYAWLSSGKEGETYEYKEGGIELPPGFYSIEAIADKEKFGQTKITIDNQNYEQISRTFKSVTDPVEVEFTWIAYADTDKMSEGAIFVNDDILADDLKKSSYEYVLTGTRGESIKKNFIKTSFSTWFVDLPYDYYKAEVKGLPEGYTVNKKEFIVNSKAFEVEFKVIPEKADEDEDEDEKVKVNFEFKYGDEKISPVKFNLDEDYETEYTDGQVELTLGEHTIEVFEPAKYIQKEEFNSFTVTKDTKNIVIELEDYKEPEPDPSPSGEGTLKFEIWESDGKSEKQSNMFISAWAGAIRLSNNEVKDKVPYGTYEVELSDYLLDKNKYDLDKSETVKTVTIDDNNPNAVVKFVLMLKGVTPSPEPKPQEPTKGTASWDYEYNGTASRIFPSVKLYKVVNGKDEAVNSFALQNEVFTLDFGKYAFIIEPSVYPKLEYENSRIEFELTKEKPNYKAIFKITDAKDTQKVNVVNLKGVNEDLSKVQFKVIDPNGKEVKVTKSSNGIEFPAVQGTLYKIVAEGNKFPYYPTHIVAFPKSMYPPTVNFTIPLPVKINSLADGKEIPAKYSVKVEGVYKVYTEDLNMIPYIPTGTQKYQVKLLSNEQGYKLVGEEIQEFTVTEYQRYELTFNFERDENVAVVDKDELRALVKEYDKIKATDAYKKADTAKKQAYDDAINEAKDELAKAVTSQDAINKLIAKVKTARDAIIGSMENLKKAELKKLLDDAKNVKAKDTYIFDTDEDKKAYDDAITNGQAVYADESASEEAINKAIADIKSALKNLDGFDEADKSELKKLLDDYDNVYKSKKYWNSTEKEREAYQDAIIEGTNTLNNKKASQEQVDAAVKAINDALAGLSGMKEPTEKTDPVILEKAYVNDKYVRGTGTVGATIYYEVVGKEGTFADTKSNLRTGMKIGSTGKFSINVGQIRQGEEIIVYQQEVNKLMSQGVKLAVLPLDKTELEDLVKEANDIKSDEKFIYGPADKKENLEEKLTEAEKILADENSSKEDIDNALINLKSALAMIKDIKLEKVTLTFKAENGTDDLTQEIIKGQKAQEPAEPVKEGYEFLGWFAGENAVERFDFNTPIEEDTTLYARWEEIKYTVTFDPANGEKEWTVKVPSGNTLARPEKDPIKENHTFLGWQLDGENYDFAAKVIKDMKLIAAYKKNEVAPEPQPQPEPRPYEPDYGYEPYEPYKPSKPEVEKPKKEENKKEEPKKTETDSKPVEEKKDYGIIETQASLPVNLTDLKDDANTEAINNVVSRGILKGTDQGTFEGEKPVSRAMVATVLMRISKDKTVDTSLTFGDIKVSEWYTDAVKWAASHGHVKGFEDGTYKPNKLITRQEMAVILARFLEKHGIQMPETEEITYKDIDGLLDWSKDSVIKMAKIGLIKGQTDGMYYPNSEFTRAELALLLDKIITWIENN